MDNSNHVLTIRMGIDKSFNELGMVTGLLGDVLNTINPSGAKVMKSSAFLYCGGYIDACVDFGIISKQEGEELENYCTRKMYGEDHEIDIG